MNSIDKLIRLADVRGTLDLRCQFQGDWTLEHEQEILGKAPYHIVLAGSCRVELPGGKGLSMRAGDILMLPNGMPHILRNSDQHVAQTSSTRITSGPVPVRHIGNSSPDLDMLCGSFHFNRGSLLLASLPSYVLIPGTAMPDDGSLQALVELLRGEADGHQLGARALLDALSQALFTLILRAHLHHHGEKNGALALLADKRMGPVWQAFLADPAHDWDIGSLAQMAAMSRATFMRTFVRLAGVSPWTLLTRIRMELAFSLLSHSHLGLSDIALQVGYQSQAAFNKKFKETYGKTPGRARRGI
ncbi:AraC family transcriptional regulator [Pseudomonas sp. ITA]|uniref:AraC family transcriptional regulator n=1 Tax=Pseudomonas sp. ITA TaxID=2825841 RepID=UPI0024961F40|nr:AraC family transcriptional regulator [Pseudomonas sp. ITA]MDI2146198.1 AraC family transcriptional regulator [Pseudomonas sp. ITA]